MLCHFFCLELKQTYEYFWYNCLLIKNAIIFNLSIYKLFDTEMFFKDLKTEKSFMQSVSSCAFISWGNNNQWQSSFIIPNWCIHSWLSCSASCCSLPLCSLWPVMVMPDFFFSIGYASSFLFACSTSYLCHLLQGKYHTCHVNVQNVYAVPQFHGGKL